MTEQDINNLKRLLTTSASEENSSELDEAILTAARERVPEATSKPWFDFMPFGSLGAAALSIALTIGSLLIMSQLTSVDEAPRPLAYVEIDSIEIVEDNIDMSKAIVAKPTINQPTLPNTEKTRDEILAGLELPSVESLMGKMEIPVTTDRNTVTKDLVAAMGDINLMIRDGELDNARERYERLRRSCAICNLPISLEALALADYSQPNGI